MKIADKQKTVDYVTKLLGTCKTWGGPCCCRYELITVLEKNPDKVKTIVKAEMPFYAHTHKADRPTRPELFRIVRIDVNEQLENLCVLLSNEDSSASRSSLAEVDLPSNDDALRSLSSDVKDQNHPVYDPNARCVNVWIENGKVVWYIGYFKKVLGDDLYEVEQLFRLKDGSDVYWQYPLQSVIDEIDSAQVLRCNNGKRFPVDGEWDYGRVNNFCLKNVDDIIKQFDKFKTKFA